MNPRRVVFWIMVVVCLAGTSVLAGSIYLNGTRIDGVTNQKFEKCTVTIDDKGDIYISAPGYAVQGQASKPAPEPAPICTPFAAKEQFNTLNKAPS